jgi:hypothetical protein
MVGEVAYGPGAGRAIPLAGIRPVGKDRWMYFAGVDNEIGLGGV